MSSSMYEPLLDGFQCRSGRKNMTCEFRDEVMSLWLNLGPIWLDYGLGGRGGLTDIDPCVSFGSHFSPPPPPHTYQPPLWISSSALLLAAPEGFPVLMTRVGEALSLAQSWSITAGL